VEFRVLGPLEVVDGDEPLSLGGGLPRRLLALLLLNRNQFVSSERLIDVLWEGRPPDTASKALQGLVSQLRKAIGQETVLTRPSGYVLRIDHGQYDADRFGSLVEEAMTARPEVAATQLRQALALWRGPAFAEFTYDDFARTEIGRPKSCAPPRSNNGSTSTSCSVGTDSSSPSCRPLRRRSRCANAYANS